MILFRGSLCMYTFSSTPKLGARSTSAMVGKVKLLYEHAAKGAVWWKTWSCYCIYDAAVVTVCTLYACGCDAQASERVMLRGRGQQMSLQDEEAENLEILVKEYLIETRTMCLNIPIAYSQEIIIHHHFWQH